MVKLDVVRTVKIAVGITTTTTTPLNARTPATLCAVGRHFAAVRSPSLNRADLFTHLFALSTWLYMSTRLRRESSMQSSGSSMFNHWICSVQWRNLLLPYARLFLPKKSLSLISPFSTQIHLLARLFQSTPMYCPYSSMYNHWICSVQRRNVLLPYARSIRS
jgi:hypothetical protein